MSPRFILASGSPRRKELIASLGIDFEVIKPDVDESRNLHEDPFLYVNRLALLKANTVARQITSSATILAADTIVVLAADTIGVDARGELLGKPDDADHAREILRKLRGRGHIVCTAFALIRINADDRIMINRDVRTVVYMRDYRDDEIEAYIKSGDPFDKAGSYAIQYADFHPVARIDGCYNNVVGLPLCAVKRALVEVKWAGVAASEGCDCEIYMGEETSNGG
jgi:septum formation protein